MKKSEIEIDKPVYNLQDYMGKIFRKVILSSQREKYEHQEKEYIYVVSSYERRDDEEYLTIGKDRENYKSLSERLMSIDYRNDNSIKLVYELYQVKNENGGWDNIDDRAITYDGNWGKNGNLSMKKLLCNYPGPVDFFVRLLKYDKNCGITKQDIVKRELKGPDLGWI
jgi:hypothetical protein